MDGEFSNTRTIGAAAAGGGDFLRAAVKLLLVKTMDGLLRWKVTPGHCWARLSKYVDLSESSVGSHTRARAEGCGVGVGVECEVTSRSKWRPTSCILLQ